MNTEIWNSIVSFKIQSDNSNRFSLPELETISGLLNISLETLCLEILKIKKTPFNNLKNGKQNYIYSPEYSIYKEEFFANFKNAFLRQIIQLKIQTDPYAGFNLEDFEELHHMLNINIDDIAINLLNINKNTFYELKTGILKKVYSDTYKVYKQEYLDNIRSTILELILKEKVKTDFKSTFSYDEIQEYSKVYNINIRDILGHILKIKNYSEYAKPIEKQKTFNSNTYKLFKDQKMQTLGNEILDSYLHSRIKRTGSPFFTKNEIEKISKLYNINERDFIVYVLGKHESTYYDMHLGRTHKCLSEKYKEQKDLLLIEKREKFMEEINPNIRNYYSLDDLHTLAENLGISTYDLVISIMGKSDSTYSSISKKENNKQRIYVGTYTSTALPNKYIEKNLDILLNIITLATFSAINYMKFNKYNCFRFYKDLLQEGFLYLSSQGNPLDKHGKPIIQTETFIKQHKNTFYKKVYFNAIENIKKMCAERKEFSGEVYDVTLKKTSYSNDYSYLEEQDYITVIIENLTNNPIDRSILKFFSENNYSNSTLQQASHIFNVSTNYITNLFDNLRDQYIDDNDLIF